jgi:hypothetical protein
MAITLTKQVTVEWDNVPSQESTYVDARNAFLQRMIAEGKTDGVWTGNSTSTTRSFSDQGAVDEFLAFIATNNAGVRNIVSQTITDI